jgi:hypothetical protein
MTLNGKKIEGKMVPLSLANEVNEVRVIMG